MDYREGAQGPGVYIIAKWYTWQRLIPDSFYHRFRAAFNRHSDIIIDDAFMKKLAVDLHPLTS